MATGTGGCRLAEDERADHIDPTARQESAAVEEQHERRSDSEELGITNFGLQTPAFVNTRRRDCAPLPHELRDRQELSNQRHIDSRETPPAGSSSRRPTTSADGPSRSSLKAQAVHRQLLRGLGDSEPASDAGEEKAGSYARIFDRTSPLRRHPFFGLTYHHGA
ncbi:unnamed protein product [Tilletia controversa]|uniref:Uncharacterized protein n=3 Tax=Tilletia TaxID=13289 RepID=A0A8X7MJA3_9BASI|nr:hypothetical protein CF336_g9060 [Tilletia laevis]KAE8194802.1 hypothetical protein CF328_g4631 [Tilletia controversa]KAE8238499.1 hypothetical protein A4X03_0g8847 [Tilletia caries]KAE8181665.1 hypothetical protein CF335_g8857 [Tilletia laevis]KAE8238071.1 hypothetical protein A4X06_0g9007 [Tilletia controversa]